MNLDNFGYPERKEISDLYEKNKGLMNTYQCVVQMLLKWIKAEESFEEYSSELQSALAEVEIFHADKKQESQIIEKLNQLMVEEASQPLNLPIPPITRLVRSRQSGQTILCQRPATEEEAAEIGFPIFGTWDDSLVPPVPFIYCRDAD